MRTSELTSSLGRMFVRVAPALAFAILALPADQAIAQQAPAAANGSVLLTGNIPECGRRAEAAFRAEGYTVTNSGAGYAWALRGPVRAVVTCFAAPNGTHAVLVVAGNDVASAITQQRDWIENAIKAPPS